LLLVANVATPTSNWSNKRMHRISFSLFGLLNREAEVYYNGRLESGLHSYSAWYHFVGRTLFGERECSPNVVFGPFSVFFHSRTSVDCCGTCSGHAHVPIRYFASV